MSSCSRLVTRAMVLFSMWVMCMPTTGWGKPCKGVSRLQLRWSPKAQTTLVAFSATACDAPPPCNAGGAARAGGALTKPPMTITISDAGGLHLSTEYNPADASCGKRCAQFNRAACSGGVDNYRTPAGSLRYVVSSPSQMILTATKLKIPSTQPPKLTAPVTVTVSDAAGYSVEMELTNCRVRRASAGAAVTCFQ